MVEEIVMIVMIMIVLHMFEEIVMIVANYDGGDGNDEQLQYECLLSYQ